MDIKIRDDYFNEIIFEIKDDENGDIVNSLDEILKTLDFHSNLEKLNAMKSSIEKLGQKEWDYLKKKINPFEAITTNYGIANYSPISRAYFKMVEIIHHFKNEIITSLNNTEFITENDKILTLHLAEGPGGFIESLNDFLVKNNYLNNEMYGITLVKDNKSIPGWKKTKIFLDIYSNVKILYGKDGTGDLYEIENILDLRNKLSKRVSVITGDGGFDFSSDFNQQEKLSFPLIYCQSLTALLCQKEGGIFILKIFDIYNKKTLCLINLLKQNYKTVKIIKPYTSRPGNSEKYLVCIDFLNKISQAEILKLLEDIPRIGLNNGNNNLEIYNYTSRNLGFYRNIKNINDVFFERQIKFIQKTLNYRDILLFEKDKENLLENQVLVSMEWCKYYNFKINFISKYIHLYIKDSS